MKESISFTIPLEVGALNRTAEMLQGMASDLEAKPCGDCTKEEKPVVVKTPSAPPTANATLDGAENMGSETPATTTPPAPPETPAATITPPGVDLDSTGLPWDGRIHGSAKKKLAKDQTWKKVRNVDPALVEQVEAELRAAMAAPAPIATIETTAPPAPPETPAATTPPPIVETTTPTTPPTPPAEITWPVFMAKVTNAMALGTLTDVRILEVVNKHGLASLPLLSARPDFIPAVNAELFPNG